MTAGTETGANHWKVLSHPELTALSIPEAVEIIGKRADDLLEARLPWGKDAVRGPVRPSVADSGTMVLRAFLMDPDAYYGYSENDLYVGVVGQPDGTLYVERSYPDIGARYQVVQLINREQPEQSTAYGWREGRLPQMVDPAEALGSVIYILGRLSYQPYADGGLTSYNAKPHTFAHPDLQ